MPRKIASVKNAKPSSEKGMPITAPAWRMNSGNKRPSSKASTVPDTAPIAKNTAVPLAQALVKARYSGARRRSHNSSARLIKIGMVMPIEAKTMWKPSESAI